MPPEPPPQAPPHATPTYFVSAPQRGPSPTPSYPTRTPTPADGIPRITVGDNYFEPSMLVIRVGVAVKFVHGGSATHTITSLNNKWAPILLGIGSESQLGFAEPGVYRYMCTIHSGMQGVIEVRN